MSGLPSVIFQAWHLGFNFLIFPLKFSSLRNIFSRLIIIAHEQGIFLEYLPRLNSFSSL